MVRAVGKGVAAIEEVPVGLADRSAARDPKGDAGVGNVAPFLLDLLALLALQAGEELGEVGVRPGRAIGPVELDRAAHRPAGRARRCLVGVVEKEEMCRRQLGRARELLDALQEQQAMLVASRQQAWARHRRERDRRDQLGVVVEAVPLIGVGPGPVEDVLAVGVVLQVERAGGDERAGMLEDEEVWCPAGGADRALRLVQRAQVGERDERRRRRLAGEQRRPGIGVDRGGIVDDLDDVLIGIGRALPARPCLVAHRRKFRPSRVAASADKASSARARVLTCLNDARHCPKLGRI